MGKINWTKDKEKELYDLKFNKEWGNKKLADYFNTNKSSIKHKYLRLKQNKNEDSHHHPKEKISQLGDYNLELTDSKILETHSGYGNLTAFYSQYSNNITSIEKKKEKYSFLESEFEHSIINADSEKYFHNFVADNKSFDWIDIDPYGFPSRFMPYIFELIDNGYLVFTFPKLGVQCLNKVTQEHYRVFWNINHEEINSEEQYKSAVIHKTYDYGLSMKRGVYLESCIDLDSVYRFLFKVERESMFDLVGLNVTGVND